MYNKCLKRPSGQRNVVGGRAGKPPEAWTVGAPAAGRVGGWAADTARRASRVTSR